MQNNRRQKKERKSASDRIDSDGQRLVIEGQAEMPEMGSPHLKRAAIYFEDKKYLWWEGRSRLPIRSATFSGRGRRQIQNAKLFHNYDAEAVAERDSSRRGEVLNEVMWICLLAIISFLGMLWSGRPAAARPVRLLPGRLRAFPSS